MPQLCMFGGHCGTLGTTADLVVTICGGAELSRPTVAQRVSELRRRGGLGDQRSYVVITLFGGTSLKWPTLTAEYLALRDALRAGEFTVEDWDRAVAMGAGATIRVNSLTLFAGLNADELPGEDAEVEALATQRHLGQLPDRALDLLTLGIGQSGPQRLAVVRRAVMATAGE